MKNKKIKLKKKKKESGHYAFWNCYMQGVPRKKQYRFSFAEQLKLQKINCFCTCSLGRSKHFEIAIYKLLRERCNNIGSSPEHLEFQKSDFNALSLNK